MSETAQSTEDAAAQRAAEQARLRKERREAKIKAGGSARLNRITGLGGRIPGEPATATSTATESPSTPTPTPAVTASSPSSTPADHADPEEVDISEHYYEPKRTASARNAPPTPEPAISEDQLRQMMLGFERGTPGRASPAPGAAGGLDEDPIMKMMSQFMAGAGIPPGSAPFPGMPGAAPQPPQPTVVRNSTSTNLWRLLHALVAIGLGLYVVVLTPFTGSKIERDRAALAGTTPADPLIAAAEPELETELEHRKRLFFWTFATAETLLLTTRFILDKRGNPPTGVVGTVLGFLPQPYKGYIEIVLRYAQIFTTVRGDILACIFVLGAVSWWKA
ncbi:hypothetical protein FALBO_16573 [Fusarium albosuccineum]|uniref:GET complex subunit GET2 n=1 Tax=Fusarium albosuccineum TaxID=1237068 RepID=A0A8H4KIL5_9HYPO|nr:hypothetical protein FALBO_16573 [Fusarium albosuccineum]